MPTKISLRIYGWATIEVDEEVTPDLIDKIESGDYDWRSKLVGEVAINEPPAVDVVSDPE